MTRKDWMAATQFVANLGLDKVQDAGDHWRIWHNGYRFSVFALGCVCHTMREEDEVVETFIEEAKLEFGAQIRNGYPIWKNKGVAIYFIGGVPTDEGELELFIDQLVGVYTTAGVDPKGLKAKDKYSAQAEETTFYQNVVTKIKLGMQLKDSGLFDRGVLGYDKVDQFITIGQSVAGADYREHVVPCDYLTNSAIEMLESGATDTEVALMIKQNLVIVLIAKSEAKVLDVDLGLKTDMPDGWSLGDDPLERLYAAGIVLQ